MKVFFDTNVLFSALAHRGVCFELLSICLRDHEVLVSEQVIAETKRTLVELTRYSSKEASEITTGVLGSATLCADRIYKEIPIRDHDDAPIYGAARSAGADVLVTGDKDLLILNGAQPMEIIRPRELLDRLK